MKVKSLLLGSLAALALLACSKEQETENPDGNIGGYMAFQLRMSGNATTKAFDTDGFEAATGDDAVVQNVALFFFNDAGNAVANPYVTTTTTAGTPDTHTPNSDDFAKVVTAPLKNLEAYPTQVVAIVNYTDYLTAAELTKTTTLAALKAKKADYVRDAAEAPTKGYVMSNSVYLDGSGNEIYTTAVTTDNIKKSETEALASPVYIHVERAVAKAVFSQDANFAANSHTNTVDNNNTIAINGTNRTVTFTLQKGWIDNRTDQTTLIKDISGYNATTPWDGWNSTAAFRSYWAKALEPSAGYLHMSSNNANGIDTPYYLNENTNIGTYDAASKIREKTPLVVISGYFSVEGITNPKHLIRFLGRIYTEEGFREYLISTPEFANLYKDDTQTNPIDADDIYVDYYDNLTHSQKYYRKPSASGTEYGKGQFIENHEALAVVRAADGKTIYDGSGTSLLGTTFKTITNAAATLNADTENHQYTVEFWRDCWGYYYMPLSHNYDLPAGTTGEYGIVRNHLYKINVKSIAGLGTPLTSTNEEIIPETPIDSDVYMSAEIEVLKYKIVAKDYEFE